MAFTKEGIDTVGSDDERYKWPRSVEAAKMAGVSKRTLENLVRNGQVSYVYDESGERHFDPSTLRENAGTVSDADVELDLTKSTYELLARANKDLQRFVDNLLKHDTERGEKVTLSLQRQIDQLSARYETLQERYIKSLDAFEAALTTAHERELARLEAQGKETRKGQAFDLAMSQLPTVLAQFARGKTNGVSTSIDTLLASLTAEQKALLFEMMTDEQKTILATIMKSSNPQSKKETSNVESKS